ncbi:hypothetical protein ACO22_02606 [Paracoccidioides brasiliensis]|uniref:Uncharacterized protein n=1 Tax=Paracoccidioides brasiliensis TaxID=121759 RepID=A0A1D2JIC1_PARBR|nr:hypothetical protein ACO22_02606 [Paracoccidioides brasiliensis]
MRLCEVKFLSGNESHAYRHVKITNCQLAVFNQVFLFHSTTDQKTNDIIESPTNHQNKTLFSTSSGSRIGTWAKRIIPNSRRRLWRREGSGLSTFAASQFSFWHLRGWELAADALLIANHARDSYREQGLKDETPPANLSSTLLALDVKTPPSVMCTQTYFARSEPSPQC